MPGEAASEALRVEQTGEKLEIKVNAAYFADREGALDASVQTSLESLQKLLTVKVDNYIKARDEMGIIHPEALNDKEARLAMLTAERLLEQEMPKTFKKPEYDKLVRQGSWSEAASRIEEGIYQPLEAFFQTSGIKDLVDMIDEKDADARRAQMALAEKFPGLYPPEGTSERGSAMNEIEQAMDPETFARKQEEMRAAWNEAEQANGGYVLRETTTVAGADE